MNWIKPDNFIPYNDPWYSTAYSKYNGSCKGTNDTIIGYRNGKPIYQQAGRPYAQILDNCVGFANGAFNETFFMNKSRENSNLEKKQYFAFTCNANQIIPNRVKDKNKHAAFKEGLVNYNEFIKNCILPPEAIPPEGGLICWG